MFRCRNQASRKFDLTKAKFGNGRWQGGMLSPGSDIVGTPAHQSVHRLLLVLRVAFVIIKILFAANRYNRSSTVLGNAVNLAIFRHWNGVP